MRLDRSIVLCVSLQNCRNLGKQTTVSRQCSLLFFLTLLRKLCCHHPQGQLAQRLFRSHDVSSYKNSLLSEKI